MPWVLGLAPILVLTIGKYRRRALNPRHLNLGRSKVLSLDFLSQSAYM